MAAINKWPTGSRQYRHPEKLHFYNYSNLWFGCTGKQKHMRLETVKARHFAPVSVASQFFHDYAWVNDYMKGGVPYEAPQAQFN